MFRKHLCLFPILCLFLIKSTYCAVLENFLRGVPVCESHCEKALDPPNASHVTKSFKKACNEGCRLFPVIGLAKDERDSNKTVKLCESACSEAFTDVAWACNMGCRSYPLYKGHENDVKTLHLLLPLAYVKSAYNSMAHHVKQFISTSWTVYLNEDSGKMVVVQTSPKVVESLEYSVSNNDMSLKDYQQQQPGVWQEGVRVGWMECLSHQSGIPRWLLVVVLMGFIVALLWLCLATAVTAPNQYINASKKKDTGYILICEPNNELKAPLLPLPEDEEAPPLPPKVSLI